MVLLLGLLLRIGGPHGALAKVDMDHPGLIARPRPRPARDVED